MNTKTKTMVETLPPAVNDVPLLVLGYDQGSVGTAGLAFAVYVLFAMVWARFCVIHRMIRDIKLAMDHCLQSIFLKACSDA